MPIYMDRHDVSESVNAENVAQLHKEDLKIQEQFNCRGLTYWFDDIKKIAFCLIEAPDKDSIHNMHNCAHGEVPNLIMEVDENIVESFLGRIEDPGNSSATDMNIINDPAQRTLMVVRYKTLSLNGIRNSQAGSNMQHAIEIFGNSVKKFGGRLIDQSDGYLLVSFKSGYNGVQCAYDLENLFTDKIASLYNSNVLIKIGLATGMPVEADKAFFEDTIKMADRLCYIDKTNIVMTTEVENLFVTENLDAPYDKNRRYTLPSSEEKCLNNMFNFIEKEWFKAELKVEDFEQPLGMSKTQVYRKFVFLTGKSPNSFLKEYRLNQALKRINKNMQTISETAYETGFNSQSYFSKCFHRRFHLLPSDYIKS